VEDEDDDDASHEAAEAAAVTTAVMEVAAANPMNVIIRPTAAAGRAAVTSGILPTIATERDDILITKDDHIPVVGTVDVVLGNLHYSCLSYYHTVQQGSICRLTVYICIYVKG
jgi:hypothetical protein